MRTTVKSDGNEGLAETLPAAPPRSAPVPSPPEDATRPAPGSFDSTPGDPAAHPEADLAAPRIRASAPSAPSPADPTRTSQPDRPLDPTRTSQPEVGDARPSRAARSPIARLRGHDRYEILSEHGRGGLGRVSRAHDRELGRDIAIKELISRGHLGEVRFLREALITARLEHPGIVPVYEAGRWADGTRSTP